MHFRKSLLAGSSAIALTTVLTCTAMLVPGSALACQTVSSDTAISDASNNCVTWNGGNLTITGSGTLTGASTGVFNPNGNTVGSLTNSGTINSFSYGIRNQDSITSIVNNGKV